MQKLLFVAIFTCLSLLAFAQADLNGSLESLKSQLVDVETKSSTFSQSLVWDKALPFKVQLTIDETGKKKGKVKTMSYAFSLKDVDANAIRSKTNKDVVEVTIYMKSKQKMIVFSEGGEFKGYVSKFKIFSVDAESGKALESNLKEAVANAKKIPSSCPSDASSGYAWLASNIGDFSVGDVAKEQSVKMEGTMLDYALTTKGKKDKDEKWFFNLADLNKRSVKLQIKSKEFYVVVKTKRNLKYIRYKKGEGKVTYTNKVKFYIEHFDQAKCLVNVLETVIKDSEKQQKAHVPTFASAQDALAAMAKNTGTVEQEKYRITQELLPSCATTLTLNEAKGSADGKSKEFKFNFLDIKEKSVKIGVKGSLVFLKLGTAKNKLVQTYKDGELASYTNKLSIVAPDIETAKLMKVAVVESAKQCRKEVGFVGFSTVKENLDWLSALLKEHVVPDVEQRLEAIEGEDCKWKFVSIKSGKKPLEEIFEFSLEDLAAKKIKWNISGKKLSIQLTTKYKEKTIKYYKNGEPGNYKNSFSIQFNDIEDARSTIAIFEKAIGICKD